jgi:hypothetical protein
LVQGALWWVYFCVWVMFDINWHLGQGTGPLPSHALFCTAWF